MPSVLRLTSDVIVDLNNLASFPEKLRFLLGDWLQGTTAEGLCSFFAHYLLNHADRNYTTAQILAGLEPTFYPSLAALQADIPVPVTTDATSAPPTEPNFAVIYGQGKLLELAYWDWPSGAAGSWVSTSFPWNFPFLTSGPVINLIPGNGTGNNAWPFSMGGEYQIVNPGNITEMYIKQGSIAPLGHRWEIRRSNVIGATAPGPTTYVPGNIVASGVHILSAANVWEPVGVGPPIPTVVGEWYIAYHYVSGVGGQLANVTTLRSGGQLTEDYAFLNQGLYNLSGGPNPGINPLPTPNTYAGGTIYGVNNLAFGP